jgi:ABC-2 type transport system ATP-binding protein
MIDLHNVTKSYGDVTAVKSLSLNVAEGEIMGIIGHNGAGKTTTLKMIVGLVSPTSGRIRVMGREMSRENTDVKRHIGFLPEESSLYEKMTVTEYLLFFAELYGVPKHEAKRRLSEILTSLDLSRRDQRTGELSKGMRRKVAIARALLHDPRVLVLDEPNAGLDPLTSFFIINYLKGLKNEGKTLLVSAHNLFHVEYICDRVAILRNGELVICDTMEAIRESLGRRVYEVIFQSDDPLSYPREDGNYVFRTSDVGQVATVLERISENDWALVNLSVRESALEEIYVRLMKE